MQKHEMKSQPTKNAPHLITDQEVMKRVRIDTMNVPSLFLRIETVIESGHGRRGLMLKGGTTVTPSPASCHFREQHRNNSELKTQKTARDY